MKTKLFPARQHSHEVAQFVIRFRRTVHGVGDFFPQQLGEARSLMRLGGDGREGSSRRFTAWRLAPPAA